MLLSRKLLMLLVASMLTFTVACDREGPAERAGENVDNAVENTGEAVERAGDNVKRNTNN